MKLLNKAYKLFWKMVEKGDNERMAKQCLPTGVEEITDIPYLDDGKRAHLFDVYYPEGKRDEKLPVIIDVHGGGLMYAYKELNKNYCFHLVKRGFCVINISYSLCPDDLYPACIKDVMSALKFIGEHLDEYPCDRDRVFITGDSAGALLAANAVLIATSEELREVYQVEPVDLDIKAAGLTSGMFYYDTGMVKVLSPGIFGKGGRKKTPYKPYLDFADIIDKGKFPPTYLVTSEEDMVQAASLKFQRLLREKGIRNELSNYPKVEDRDLEHVFSVLFPSEYPESVETIDKMTRFFLDSVK